jgi:uncharacterized membrane protein YeaQ/YmgE (transglycosylase-associated protein family)
MNLIAFLLIGLIAGWISSQMIEGGGLGWLGDTLLGIFGAFVGGLMFGVLGVYSYGVWGDLVMATIGSIAVLYLVRLVPSRGSRTHTIHR